MIHRWMAAALMATAGALCPVATAADSKATPTLAALPAKSLDAMGCFVSGDGYLRARIRGAMSLDLDWKDAQMQCDGGPRPSGNGMRVNIGGPLHGDGHRIRFVFGIAGVNEGHDGESLRTNVTILFEGEKRIFATQGDDKCTVDALKQRRVETLGGGRAIYRVEAHQPGT